MVSWLLLIYQMISPCPVHTNWTLPPAGVILLSGLRSMAAQIHWSITLKASLQQLLTCAHYPRQERYQNNRYNLLNDRLIHDLNFSHHSEQATVVLTVLCTLVYFTLCAWLWKQCRAGNIEDKVTCYEPASARLVIYQETVI